MNPMLFRVTRHPYPASRLRGPRSTRPEMSGMWPNACLTTQRRLPHRAPAVASHEVWSRLHRCMHCGRPDRWVPEHSLSKATDEQGGQQGLLERTPPPGYLLSRRKEMLFAVAIMVEPS